MTTIGVENLDGTIHFAFVKRTNKKTEQLLVRHYKTRIRIYNLLHESPNGSLVVFANAPVQKASSIRSFLSNAHQAGSKLNYLFKDNQWFVNDELTEGLRPLIMKGES